MPRIRSVHPGLFTDEAFVTLSDAAQILLIGLWTESDDQGVFAWKPITLKMRLRPASDYGVEPLLHEMLAVDSICHFEAGGKEFGAIRNFRKFQRPKKSNAVHPLPTELRKYVGLEGGNPEPDPLLGGDSSELDTPSSDASSEPEPPLDTKSTEPVRNSPPSKDASVPQKKEMTIQREEILGGEGEGENRNTQNARARPSPADLESAKTIWNKTFADTNVPVVRTLADQRKRLLGARLKDLGGLDGWRGYCQRIHASTYLTGQVKDWTATLDWVLKPGNAEKILDGNFDTKRPDQNRGGGKVQNPFAIATLEDRARDADAPPREDTARLEGRSRDPGG